jgi:hypothetical protein
MGELHSLLDMHVCWLGGMAAADARFVIDNIAGAKGCVFSEADIEHLLNLTGGYAASLKIASLWLARTPAPPPPEQWLGALLAEPSLQNRLQVLWQNLTGEEQLVLGELQNLPLQATAHQNFGRHYAQTLAHLEARQLCRRDTAGRWHIFSPLLGAYIKRLSLIDTGKIYHRASDDVILRGNRSLEGELAPQARRLLLFFLHNPQRIVGKDEIAAALWSETEIYEQGLDDARLQKAVSQLRQVLEKGEDAPCYIKTEPKQGYRFFPEGAPQS